MKQLCTLLLIICSWQVLIAQVADAPYFERDTTSTYTIGLNVKFVDFASVLSYGSESVVYENAVQSVGIRLRYKTISAVVGTSTYTLPNDTREPASSLNLVVRLYPKNFYLRIDGSFVADQSTILDYLLRFRESYTSDISTWNLDVYALYAFNKDRVNLESYFSYLGKQLRTSGSWVGNIYSKTAIVHSNEDVIVSLGLSPKVVPVDLLSSRIGLGGGYLQSVKLTRDISFAAMMSFAFEVVSSRGYDEMESKRSSEIDFVFNVKPHGFANIVWNRGCYYAGVQAEYFPDVASRLQNSYVYEFYYLRLSGGYRW